MHLCLSNSLRWLEIVSWCVQSELLNTATESRPMYATIELQMVYVASAPGSSMRKMRACTLEIFGKLILDFDQKYLWKLTVKIFKSWHSGKERTQISVLIERNFQDFSRTFKDQINKNQGPLKLKQNWLSNKTNKQIYYISYNSTSRVNQLFKLNLIRVRQNS